METVVVIDGNDRRRYDDSELENSAYSMSLHEQIADPVEGDGRLVPATDDEIMEVVDLLKDEKSDMDIVDTCEENVTSSTCGSLGRKTVLDTSGIISSSICISNYLKMGLHRCLDNKPRICHQKQVDIVTMRCTLTIIPGVTMEDVWKAHNLFFTKEKSVLIFFGMAPANRLEWLRAIKL